MLDNENILEVDVIICDVRMPKVNGIEAVAYFRENYASIPIIVLTGYPDVQLAVDFMKGGVVDYLVKPVEKAKLVETVTKAARQRTIFSGAQPKV
jgi:two-component system chemotaxis response regulator CheY